MNTKNNKRKRESRQRIEKVFVELLQTKEINQISVTEICKTAEVNRTTFYANYLDIYDLLDRIGDRMVEDFHTLYADEEFNKYNSKDFTKLFFHIKENQMLYKTYFKLGLDSHFKVAKYDTALAEQQYHNQHVEYHIEYFRAGITAIIKIWLNHGCDLEPSELSQIIKEEYQNKHPI